MNSLAFGIPAPSPVSPERCVIAGGRLTVELHREIAGLERSWREFEQRAACTVFQTYRWLSLWVDKVGAPAGMEPLIVTGRDTAGALTFILPFSLDDQRGPRILGWLGGRHANYQFGLYDPAWLVSDTAAAFDRIWPDIVELLPEFDLLRFADQPETWRGYPNPFTLLPHAPSANRSHVLHLAEDFETLYATKRSAATRRSARKRDKRLEQEGAVAFHHPSTADDTAAAIDILFSQKIPHMQAIGVGDVYGPEFPAFLKALAVPDGDRPALIDVRRLTCGDETIATVLGAVAAGRYYGLVLSMTDGPLRRHSPGEFALRRTIEACCRMGLKEFDLSQGEASYKSAWSDEVLEQFDTVIGYTARGCAHAAAAGASLWAKRHIKQSPHLLAIANVLRRSLLGRSPAS